jgi:hypothetical protein
MKTKHEFLMDICKKLGIKRNSNWFSKGSTITRDGLDAIFQKVSALKSDFHVKTKPIPEEMRGLFIKYLRGFEEYYRIITSEDVFLEIEILLNGGIGIRFSNVLGEKNQDKQSKKFAEWIMFSSTGDPQYISSFASLDIAQQALIMNSWKRHMDDIVYTKLITHNLKSVPKTIQSSGLLPTTITVNNIIDISPSIIANANSEVQNTISINNIYEEIVEAFGENNNNKLKELLEKAAKEEKKSSGYLRNIFSQGKGAAGNLIKKMILGWISNPKNIHGWPSWMADIISTGLA